MKHLNIFLPALALVCAACSQDILNHSDPELSDGRAEISLAVAIPAPVSTRSVDENAVDENGFIIFCFEHDEDADIKGPKLIWVIKSMETNSGTNLDEFTGTPSIKWRKDVLPTNYTGEIRNQTYGTLYFEADESAKPIDLLVLANVDVDKLVIENKNGKITYYIGDFKFSPGGSATSDTYLASVETAILEVFAFNVADFNGDRGANSEDKNKFIPMAGRTTIESGVHEGVIANMALYRSLAKVGVTVGYDTSSDAKFLPRTVKVVNVSTDASSYAPNVGEICIPYNTGTYDAQAAFNGYSKTMSGGVSASARLLVGETQINTDNLHVCVLVGGIFDSEGVLDENGSPKDYSNMPKTASVSWYRLDFIPYDYETESPGREISAVTRNHNYVFSVNNLSLKGAESEQAAKDLRYADNYLPGGGGNWFLYVEDEEIRFTAMDYESAEGSDGTPDYLGLSATQLSVELPAGIGDFQKSNDPPPSGQIKLVTGRKDWNVEAGIDPGNCEGVFTFIFTEDKDTDNEIYLYNSVTGGTSYPAKSGSLQVLANGENAAKTLYEETLKEGLTFSFTIVVGNVRKEISVTPVVKSDFFL